MSTKVVSVQSDAIWKTRRLLVEWASAHARIRELSAESDRINEASEEVYGEIYRRIPDGTPRNDGVTHDMADTLSRLEETARGYAALIERNYRETTRLFGLKLAVDAAVWGLPGHLERVITARYKARKDWETIAGDERTSERTVRRWELTALVRLSADERIKGLFDKTGV